jgi:hypothetical protein
MAIASPLPARGSRSVGPHRPSRILIAALVGLVTLAATVSSQAQQPTTPTERSPDGPEYPVSQFSIQYASEHPDHPPLESWLPVEVQLGVRDARLTEPREGLARETITIDQSAGIVRLYHASALASVSRQLVATLRDAGLIGLYIIPNPSDIDPATEADLRRSGDTILRLIVSTGQLRRIRTISLGHTGDGSRIDNKIHRRIRARSPLQPAKDAREDTSDLLRKDVLEEYLYYLNRHPGRYVEAALAPGPEGVGADLDFRINEGRPWQVYFQSSNTGTSQTAKWQNRFGFVNRQLTRRDDILTFDYMNAGGDKVHSVNLSYEAPWFDSERPDWWKTSGREPSWISWFNRDRMPWWGVKRLRWQIAGNWTQFKATGLASPNSGSFEGFSFDGTDWNASGSLIYNFFQSRNLFIDLVGGLRVRGIEAVSQQTQNVSKPILVLPTIGLRLERFQEIWSLFGDLEFEANVNKIEDPQNLGRPGADRTWQLLTWNAVASSYLEPLLFPAAWRDTTNPATSTLAHELYFSTRGQYAFGNRLISQATQVVGGLYSVRGYPQSTATGDDVFIGTLEYRLHVPRMLPIRRKPVRVPRLGDFYLTRQQPYGRADWDFIIRLFADVGYTQQNLPETGSNLLEVDQFLAGAGLGAELTIKSYLRVRIDYAWALSDSKDTLEPVKAGHNEIYFQFNLLF